MLLILFTHLIFCKRWLVTESINLIQYTGHRKTCISGPYAAIPKAHAEFEHAQSPLCSVEHQTLPALKDAMRAEFFQGCSNSRCFKTLFGYLFCLFPKVYYSTSHERSEPQLWKDLL